MDNATNWANMTPEEQLVLRHMRPSRSQMLEILDSPQPALDADYLALLRKMTSVMLHNDFASPKGALNSAHVLGSTVDEEFPACQLPWLFCLPRAENVVAFSTRVTARFGASDAVDGVVVERVSAAIVQVNGELCRVGGTTLCGRFMVVSVNDVGALVEVCHSFVVDARGSVQSHSPAALSAFELVFEHEHAVDGVPMWCFSVGHRVHTARRSSFLPLARQLEVIGRTFSARTTFCVLVRVRFDTADADTAARLAGRYVSCASSLELMWGGQTVCQVDWTLQKGDSWTAYNHCRVSVVELDAREVGVHDSSPMDADHDDGDQTNDIVSQSVPDVKSASRRMHMMLVACELHMVVPHERLPGCAARLHHGCKFVLPAPHRQRVGAAFALPTTFAFATAAAKLAADTWRVARDLALVCGVPMETSQAEFEAMPKVGGTAALAGNVFTTLCQDEASVGGQCRHTGAIDAIRRKLPATSTNPLVLALVAGHCGGVGTIPQVCKDPACPARAVAERAAALRTALEDAVGVAYRNVAALAKTYKAVWDVGRFPRAGAVCPEAVLSPANKAHVQEYVKECMAAVSRTGSIHDARARFNGKEFDMHAHADQACVARELVGRFKGVHRLERASLTSPSTTPLVTATSPDVTNVHFTDIDDATLVFSMADTTCESLLSVLSLVPGLSTDCSLMLGAAVEDACDKAEAAAKALVLLKNTFGVLRLKDASDVLPDWRNIAKFLDSATAVAKAMDVVALRARRLAATMQDRALGQFKKVLLQFANYGDAHLAAVLNTTQARDAEERLRTACPSTCTKLHCVDPSADSMDVRVGSAYPFRYSRKHYGPYVQDADGHVTCTHPAHGSAPYGLERLLSYPCRGCGQTAGPSAFGVRDDAPSSSSSSTVFCRVCATTVRTDIYQVDACVTCVRMGRIPVLTYGEDYEEPFFCDGVTKAVTCRSCGAIQAYNALDDGDEVTYSEDAEAGTSNSRAGRTSFRDLILRTDISRNGCSTTQMRAFRTTMSEVDRNCELRVVKNTTTLHARQLGIDRLRTFVDTFVSDGTVTSVAGKLIKDLYARVRLAERVHSDTAVFPLLIVLALFKGRKDALALGRGVCKPCVFCKVQVPVLKTQEHTLKCAKMFLAKTLEYASSGTVNAGLLEARAAATKIIDVHERQVKTEFVAERQGRARAAKLRAHIEVDLMDADSVAALFGDIDGDMELADATTCSKKRRVGV